MESMDRESMRIAEKSPALGETPGGPGIAAFPRFLRGFVEGNYFYVFSALLMMLGSYLVMSSSWLEATAFARTLGSLSILQGYELLILGTAFLIVARFRRLGDAFTLLVIELTLLLDPTFFSNAFTTIPNAEATPFDVRWINAGCFLFMIVKIAVIQRILHIRMSPRGLLGFVAAGFFVYLAEGPLNRETGGMSRAGYYYLLGWAPFALVALFPRIGGVALVRDTRPGFITPRQAAWLPRFVYALPLLIVAAHFFESSNVYGVRFYWSYGAGLLLALALIVTKHCPRESSGRGIVGVDVLGAIALLLSLPAVSIGGKSALHGGLPDAPAFLVGWMPLALCGAALAGLYGYYAWTHGHRPALIRLAVMAAGGVLYGFVKLGVAAASIDAVVAALRWVVGLVGNHPGVIATIVWAALAAVAIRFRVYTAWLLFGLYSIVFGAWLLPGGLAEWFPEVLQAAIVLGLVLSHVYGGAADRPERTMAALFLAGIGSVRYIGEPTGIAGAVAVAEIVGLIAAGIGFRHAGYLVIGALQGLVVVGFLGRHLPGSVPPAAAVLAAGLTLFFIGVVVTFKKERILEWTSRWGESPRVGSSSVGSDSCHVSLASAASVPSLPIPRKAPAPPFAPAASPAPAPAAVPPPAAPCHAAPVSPDIRAARESLLKSIFLTDARAGIFLAEDLDARNITDATSGIDWLSGEALVVCFAAGDEDSKPWPVLLTSMRVLVRPPDRPLTLSVYYPQIAYIARQLGTVLFAGHAGQILMCPGLSVAQAAILKRGLERLLAETALDPPTDARS